MKFRKRAQPILGTIVEIAVPAECAAAADAAYSVIRQVHALMSFHQSASDVSRINRARPGEHVECDSMTIEVIELAASLHDESGGVFDICVAPHLVRDGFRPGRGYLGPSVFRARTSDIMVTGSQTLQLKRPVLIDLGGIAKGYAVDRAVESLQSSGVGAGMVNAGGDLRCFGDEAWPVQLRRADGRLEREICLPPCAIASSENASSRRRRWMKVVTPHRGKQRESVQIDETVSVVANRCAVADAMTKVAMVDVALANSILAGHEGCVLAPAKAAEAMS
jgi:thiamine biosynthesis lipoprotein